MRGHGGPHVAHSLFKRVVAVWDSGTGTQVAAPTQTRVPESRAHGGLGAKRPVGLRGGADGGIVESLWGLVVRTLSSWEEVAFIFLFIVFVKFAIDVLMTLH